MGHNLGMVKIEAFENSHFMHQTVRALTSLVLEIWLQLCIYAWLQKWNDLMGSTVDWYRACMYELPNANVIISTVTVKILASGSVTTSTHILTCLVHWH